MENVWQFLHSNKPSLLVWANYDAIDDALVSAWHFLIGHPERMRSIGSRDWACVSLQSDWCNLDVRGSEVRHRRNPDK
jgi:hypothetical protein